MLKVFITNLGKYNEGELVGKWVELPVYDDELAEILDEIQICHDDVKYYNSVGAPYEEIFITDYECDDIPDLKIDEHASIDTLNELEEDLESLSEEDIDAINIIVNEAGYTVEEAMDIVNANEYLIYYECYNMTDVAYAIIEENGTLNNVPEILSRYFDYEAFGRDLKLEGNFYLGNNNNGVCVEILS